MSRSIYIYIRIMLYVKRVMLFLCNMCAYVYIYIYVILDIISNILYHVFNINDRLLQMLNIVYHTLYTTSYIRSQRSHNISYANKTQYIIYCL